MKQKNGCLAEPAKITSLPSSQAVQFIETPTILAFHTFLYNQKYYVINVERMTTHLVNRHVSLSLSRLASDPRLELSAETLERLQEIGLIRSTCKSDQRVACRESNPVGIKNISIFVAQKCNLSCTYCYGGDGEYGSRSQMSIDIAKQAIDWQIEQSQDQCELGVAFFGGEPLLNLPVIHETIKYANQRGRQCGKSFSFELTTNGTLLNDDERAYFLENNVRVHISFDGPPEVQDRNRPFKNGMGSYSSIIPKIEKQLEIVPETECRVTHVGDTDALETRKSMEGIGFNVVHFSIAADSQLNTQLNERSRRNEFNELLRVNQFEADQLLKKIKERDVNYIRNLSGSIFIVKVIANFLTRQKHNFHCGAGKGYTAISADGNAYACHRFVGIEKHRIGNIYNSKLDRDIYLESPIEKVEQCKKCPAKYVCSGGCYHDHEGATGDIFEPDPEFCEYMIASLELVAYIVCQLDKLDKSFLVEHGIIPERICGLDF